MYCQTCIEICSGQAITRGTDASQPSIARNAFTAELASGIAAKLNRRRTHQHRLPRRCRRPALGRKLVAPTTRRLSCGRPARATASRHDFSRVTNRPKEHRALAPEVTHSSSSHRRLRGHRARPAPNSRTRRHSHRPRPEERNDAPRRARPLGRPRPLSKPPISPKKPTANSGSSRSAQSQAAAGHDDRRAKSALRTVPIDGPLAASPTHSNAAALADAIQSIPDLDRSKLLLFGGWESATRGAGATMQIVGERLGITEQFQGVDEIKVSDDGSFEILERIEGGRHQVSLCTSAPAVLGWATGNLASRATIRKSAWSTCAPSCPHSESQARTDRCRNAHLRRGRTPQAAAQYSY